MNTIGASTVPAILGLSPWQSPMQAWARLTGLVPADEGNATTERGKIMEPAIREEYARRLGVLVSPGPAYEAEPFRAPAPYEWAHCRPDAWYRYRLESADLTLVEIKTTRAFSEEWGEEGSAEIPAHYLAQVLWQMAIVSLQGERVVATDVVAFSTQADELRVYRIPYDSGRVDALLGAVAAWRERHILGGEPPPADGSEGTRKLLARLYPGGQEKVLIDPTPDDISDAALIAAGQAIIAESEARVDAAKARIMERIGKAGATGIRGVATWAPVKGRAGFDHKAAVAADPSLSRFATIGEPTRRFTLTPAKE